MNVNINFSCNYCDCSQIRTFLSYGQRFILLGIGGCAFIYTFVIGFVACLRNEVYIYKDVESDVGIL